MTDGHHRIMLSFECLVQNCTNQTKLRGRSPQRTIPIERPPLVGEVSANI
jgi:hypothetical protein